MNVYISILTLGLKYMKILGNFSEISEIITSSDTWGWGLYVGDYYSNSLFCEISLEFL